MSTKIYTGFRITHNNVAEILSELKSIQLKFTTFFQDLIISNFNKESKIEDIEKLITDRTQKGMFSANVVIYPLQDKIIGTYYIQHPILVEYFLALPQIIDYHYQDQTDQDEDISDEEWEQRRKDWSFLNVPLYDGFSFELVDKNKLQSYIIYNIIHNGR